MTVHCAALAVSPGQNEATLAAFWTAAIMASVPMHELRSM